jgi:hypothetical protein
MVVLLGPNTPVIKTPDSRIHADYLLGIGWAALLALGIVLSPIPPHHKRILLLIWLVRCFITLGFMLLYEYNYAALDMYTYVRKSRDAWLSWVGTIGSAGSDRTAMVFWWHNYVFPNAYHVFKVSFTMLGLASVYLFYLAATTFLQRDVPRLLYFLGLFPSVLFWSSIPGKDGLIFFSIALYVYSVVAWYRHRNIVYLVLLVAGIAGAVLIRPWMGIIMCAPLVPFFLVTVRHLLLRVALGGVVVVATWLVLTNLPTMFTLETTDDVVALANDLVRRFDLGESTQAGSAEFDSLEDLVFFMPFGMFTALFRPLPGEVLNPFGLLAGLENAVLLVLLVRAISRSRWRDVQHPVLLWLILFIVIWLSMYAFVAYNLGTIVRYKLQILPMLLCLLLYLAQRRQHHPFVQRGRIPARGAVLHLRQR